MEDGQAELGGLVGGEVELEAEGDAIEVGGGPEGAHDAVVGVARAEKDVADFVSDGVTENAIGAIAFRGEFVDALIEDVQLACGFGDGADLGKAERVLGMASFVCHGPRKNAEDEVGGAHGRIARLKGDGV